MLPFHTITLQDRGWMTDCYRKKDYMCAQYSFASNFLWQDGYGLTVCLHDGVFFLRAQLSDNEAAYRVPLTDTPEQLYRAMKQLHRHCAENNEKLRLIGILSTEKKWLEQLFPDQLIFCSKREEAEYIYPREQLETLAGKKMHAKRNFVNRFCKNQWAFEPLTAERIEHCRRLHREWCRRNQCGRSLGLCAEKKAVNRCFENWEQLGLCGGVLYQEGEAVAYTVGEPIGGDTFAVHFEKAFGDVEGAYATVNQMFIKQSAGDCTWVNREEDMGDEGMRQAKLSYHPSQLLEVFEAVWRHA